MAPIAAEVERETDRADEREHGTADQIGERHGDHDVLAISAWNACANVESSAAASSSA